ncbi:Regulatory associated protein of TOR domain-containing protein [Rozella allomycis CSF55]|uniref:Regulatory associated protein of TOR domain-containing protein n=1 Tax=Rozella allomycis (strain CSF55) TaxID=988480 RepID=A0A075AX46_ROZAC|nr:Regulatory associated protein of TOR domain-containing protein [Rozella allomycis CSF55]|eukprot:EPZ34714.1 Regulatory associated protein of TOR domain-containing protein [Rozella allomycis CSF55]
MAFNPYQSDKFKAFIPSDQISEYQDYLTFQCNSYKATEQEVTETWRMRDRLKTVSVGLVVCLNIGVDPPDVIRPNPCATLECWVDTTGQAPGKALENIGKNLQQQYEFWQPRARYRTALDPTTDDVKKLCIGLRKSSKDERVLLHYNGHGVPRPTINGEIWVFNKEYTQYVPLSLYDLLSWVGSPSVFVFDCSCAGYLIQSYNKFEKHEQGMSAIFLAACSKNESLPMNPDLPADLFTSCLTTPIEISIRWFVLQRDLLWHVPMDVAVKIPGKLNDRKTPLGELNWIFTAITDTIAWSVFPRELFKKLFRQDLMVAGLFRNYLLAERIMKSYGCNVTSIPSLPPTSHHELWETWDLVLDMCLSQINDVLKEKKEYEFSSFFEDQLVCFEKWLDRGERRAPIQLPIVLQVLLSQQHRIRALRLIARFVDLGPWAVREALSVGIFPYTLKLLQSPAVELKEVLVYIWCKIICVDLSVQSDLLKDSAFMYFVNILKNVEEPLDRRKMCLLILTLFCKDHPAGQEAICGVEMELESDCLRQWQCVFKGILIKNNQLLKLEFLKDYEKMHLWISDRDANVRASVLFLLTCSLGGEEEVFLDYETKIALSLISLINDSSPIVRNELVIFYSHFIYLYFNKFILAAFDLIEKKGDKSRYSLMDLDKAGFSAFSPVWKAMLVLSVDSYPSVSTPAKHCVDQIHSQFIRKKNRFTSSQPELSSSSMFDSSRSFKTSNFSINPNNNNPIKLPLKSSFLEYSTEFFNKEKSLNLNKWKQQRNWKMKQEYLQSDLDLLKFDEFGVLTNDLDSNIDYCKFHTFDSHLISCSNSTLTIWDWKFGKKINEFKNHENKQCKISNICFLNEENDSMIACASNDGIVRIWKDYNHQFNESLVTSWRCLLDLMPMRNFPNVFVDFWQNCGTLVCAGDSKSIKLWDVEKQSCINDISTHCMVGATCLTTERVGCCLIVAGFVDGSLRFYDKRLKSSNCIVNTFHEHSTAVLNVKLQNQGFRDVISGSAEGDIRYWDVSSTASIKSLNLSRISSLDFHDAYPLIASSSENQDVKIFNSDGHILSNNKYHEGFLGHRISPVTSLSFHSLDTVLAVGSTDGDITIFKATKI